MGTTTNSKRILQSFALALALALAAAGCAGEVPDQGGDGADSVISWSGAALTSQLAGTREHIAERPFALISLLYRGDAGVRLEVSTAGDDGVWSPFRPVSFEAAEDDDFVGELALAADQASFRVRAIGEAQPTFLSVELLGAEDSVLAADEHLDEDVLDAVDDGVLTFAVAATSTPKTYRFGAGRVTKPWLWLLKGARRAGWRGTLAGPRTGLRTYAQQASLYRAYLNGTGAPAFPPNGPSRHLLRNVKRLGRWAQAIDTQDVYTLIRYASRKGIRLHLPYSNEPWHVEARSYFRQPVGWNP